MTFGIALNIMLAASAGAYTAGAIVLLLGKWRAENRGAPLLLVLAFIAFAADRAYPQSQPSGTVILILASLVTALAALLALVSIVRTRIAEPRDGLWAIFAAVPAIVLLLLATADVFSPDVASTLRTTAVAFFAIPGIAALLFYFTVTAKIIVP